MLAWCATTVACAAAGAASASPVVTRASALRRRAARPACCMSDAPSVAGYLGEALGFADPPRDGGALVGTRARLRASVPAYDYRLARSRVEMWMGSRPYGRALMRRARRPAAAAAR